MHSTSKMLMICAHDAREFNFSSASTVCVHDVMRHNVVV